MPSNSSPEHNRLISATVAAMIRQQMTDIRADHISGYVQPSAIGSYIPDVTAIFKGAVCVAECETREGLAQTHTADQWRTFHQYAKRNNGWFIAVVATTDKAAGQALLTQVCGNSENAILWSL